MTLPPPLPLGRGGGPSSDNVCAAGTLCWNASCDICVGVVPVGVGPPMMKPSKPCGTRSSKMSRWLLIWPTSAAGTDGIKAQYFAADTTGGDNKIKPHLNLVNIGASAVALSGITVRYGYTIDGVLPRTFWCDWTALVCSAGSGAPLGLAIALGGILLGRRRR